MSASTAFLFDLDGTVTRAELLPLIARRAGIEEEIAALTEATIAGVIPFQKSFQLRVALLRDVPIRTINQVVQEVPLYGQVVDFMRKNRARVFVVTGNLDVWVRPLLDLIDCESYSSTATVVPSGGVRLETILDKSNAVADVRRNFDRVVSIGDGMGDVPMFEASDVAVAYGATHNPVDTLLEYANYVCFREESLCRLLTQL